MKKIAFVLTAPSGLGDTYLSGLPTSTKEIVDFFKTDYEVSFQADQGAELDYVIVPDSFISFINQTTAREIPVPAKFFITKDYAAIKKLIDQEINN